MKKCLAGVVAVILLSGCVSNPIPPDYTGPLATIRDSFRPESNSRAQIYFLSEINGERVSSAMGATREASQGRGFSLTPVAFSREVPARTALFTLEGRVEYGAPIQAIVNASTVYTAKKTFTFTPESNKTYVVRGTLTAEKQEVWLEDATTGKRID